jgi:UDP-glucose 4-epimerase
VEKDDRRWLRLGRLHLVLSPPTIGKATADFKHPVRFPADGHRVAADGGHGRKSVRSLVTGGAGFIGSHVVDALLGRGDEIVVVDDLSSGRRENLAGAIDRGARLVEASIVDRGATGAEIASFRPERVFHLAAQIDVRRSVEDPAFDAEVNVVGTAGLLEALGALAEPASVVFASTGGAIYGEGDGLELPLAEDAAARPEAPYGTAKLAAEGYVDLYARTAGAGAASLRFANVYGPRQDPHGEAGVVAIFCGRIREGEPLTVFGDGLQTRDYVYVEDVVAAILAADERLAAGWRPGSPLNVGTGAETTVLELVELLASRAGADAPVEHAPERGGDVRRIAIDPALAARELGWRPAVELGDGLGRTYEALAGR